MSRFDSSLTEELYLVALDGCAERTTGDVDFGVHADLVADDDGTLHLLLSDEQGFVSSSPTDAQERFDMIDTEYAEWLDAEKDSN